MRVRWVDGKQSYDAIVLSRGFDVTEGLAKPRQFVEVTGVMHENDHLRRRLLEEQGGSFGPRGIKVDPKTKKITSEPYVTSDEEVSDDLLKRVLDNIAKKMRSPTRLIRRS